MGKTSTSLRRSLSEIRGKGKYPSLLEKLIDAKDWVSDTLIRPPLRQFKALKRVLEWVPVLWFNYDWDHGYMFELMKYKLDRMEKHIRKYGHHVGNDKTADSIKTAKLLLDRICNKDYVSDAVEPIDKEYGGWKFDWRSKTFNKVYNKELTNKQAKEYDKATLRAYKHSDYMEKQDIEYLFKYMTKNHKKWWDVWTFALVPTLLAASELASYL